MGSSRPWIDTAENIIKQSRVAEQPVWIDQAVEDILRQHPDFGLGKAALADILYGMVIDQRWSLAHDGRKLGLDRADAST